jgi:hypothetical protein
MYLPYGDARKVRLSNRNLNSSQLSFRETRLEEEVVVKVQQEENRRETHRAVRKWILGGVPEFFSV